MRAPDTRAVIEAQATDRLRREIDQLRKQNGMLRRALRHECPNCCEEFRKQRTDILAEAIR